MAGAIFPIKGRAENLQIDFHYIKRKVSKFLGYGWGNTLDDEQTQAVQEIIDDGVRQYVYPPPLPGVDASHEWTFMRPTWRLKTEGDQRRYLLPEDWERMIGNLCYTDTENDFYTPIKMTSASRLRQLEYLDNFTSYPQWAA